MLSSRITNIKMFRSVIFALLVICTILVGIKLLVAMPEPSADFSGTMGPFQIKQLKAQLGRLKRELAKNQITNPYEYLDSMPIIYAITPTHTRPVQKAELVRISQTFLLVPNFHWIVIEDAEAKTPLVSNLLEASGLSYTHLNALTPAEWKLALTAAQWKKPRGVNQRNAGLEWLRKHADPRKPGVVFFADDDNTYSLELFEEMRWTKRASVWPVGLVGGLLYERPLLNQKGKVEKWLSSWRPERPFAIDMAGFAINLQLILDRPEALFSNEVPRGYQESTILGAVATKEDLEPKADQCKKVYVWHTRTENPKRNETAIKLQLENAENIEV